MASKRDSLWDPPPLSGGVEARASWVDIEIEIEIDMSDEHSRPPAISLPGIEVQDEWLEPAPRNAGASTPSATPKPPPSSGRAPGKAVDPFLGMRMPARSRPPQSAPQGDFDDEAPTVPRRHA